MAAVHGGEVIGGYCFDFGKDVDVRTEIEDLVQIVLRRYDREQFMDERTTSPRDLSEPGVDPVVAITAAMHFAYNANFEEFVEVYGERPDSDSVKRDGYLLNKYDLMKKQFGNFIAALDGEHRRRFMELALRRYRERG